MKTTYDLEKLDDVKVTCRKDAFKPKVMHCSRDNSKMERVLKDMPISENIKVTLNVFKCKKCNEEKLGFDEAKKLDKALMLNRIIEMRGSFSLKRKLSFDGDNYVFRIPNSLTQGRKHKEVEIYPLDDKEALIRW